MQPVQDTSQSQGGQKGDHDGGQVQPATTNTRVCRKEELRLEHADLKLHTWRYQHTTRDFLCWMTWRCDLWRHRSMSRSRGKTTNLTFYDFFSLLFDEKWKKNNVLFVCLTSCVLTFDICINNDMYSTLILFTNWSLDTNSFLFSRDYWCLYSIFLRSFFGSEQVQTHIVIRNGLKTDTPVLK